MKITTRIMLKSTLTIVTLFVTFNLFAQSQPMANVNRAPPLKAMPVAPPETEGTVFLNVVRPQGLEPWTISLKGSCSTI